MKRFFLIPLLSLAILAAGCTCSMRGSATIPTKAPTASPTMKATPRVTAVPATPEPTVVPETPAPVEPTPANASPSADATAGN